MRKRTPDWRPVDPATTLGLRFNDEGGPEPVAPPREEVIQHAPNGEAKKIEWIREKARELLEKIEEVGAEEARSWLKVVAPSYESDIIAEAAATKGVRDPITPKIEVTHEEHKQIERITGSKSHTLIESGAIVEPVSRAERIRDDLTHATLPARAGTRGIQRRLEEREADRSHFTQNDRVPQGYATEAQKAMERLAREVSEGTIDAVSEETLRRALVIGSIDAYSHAFNGREKLEAVRNIREAFRMKERMREIKAAHLRARERTPSAAPEKLDQALREAANRE